MKMNNIRVLSNLNKRKRSEVKAEHASSLPNKEHESVSKTSNRHYCNIQYFEKIYQIIPEGRNNAVSMSQLSERLHVDARQCRKIISEMRNQGYLIVGDNHGYYVPTTNEELFRWYQSVRSRAMTGLKGLKYARRIMKGNGIETPEVDLDNISNETEI